MKSIKAKTIEIWSVLILSIRSFGFFPFLFVTIISAPSVLVISETVFYGFELMPAFQWIVDGWARINRVLGDLLEPITSPVVNWIKSWGLDIDLHQHWQAMFWLLLAPVFSTTRASHLSIKHNRSFSNRNAQRNFVQGSFIAQILLLIIIGVPLLIGAFISGLTASRDDWVSQGIIASIPVIVASVGYIPIAFLGSGLDKSGKYKFRPIYQFIKTIKYLIYAAFVSIILFVFSATLSLIPGVSQSALLLFTLILLALGLFLLVKAFKGDDLLILLLNGSNEGSSLTLLLAGLGILGGFFTAGMIIIANFFIKLAI